MGTRKVTLGRLWIETEGEGVHCAYFKRTRWEDIEVELPEELIPEDLGEDRWSIVTEAGETLEP